MHLQNASVIDRKYSGIIDFGETGNYSHEL